MKLKEAQQHVKDFAVSQGWDDSPCVDKFDHLHEELIEMSKHLRYKNKEQRQQALQEYKEDFKDGMGDLLFAMCRLANQLDIDLEEAFHHVKERIGQRFSGITEDYWNYWNIWKEVMFTPGDFYKKLPKKFGYKEPMLFALVLQALTLGIIYVVLLTLGIVIIQSSVLFGMLGAISISIGTLMVGLTILFFFFFLLSWGGLFLVAGLVHLVVMLFQGKGGYKETFRIICYATAPNVFGFIPFVNYVAPVYGLVLQGIGVHEKHGLSVSQSVMVVILPLFILLALVLIFFLTSMMPFMGGMY
jgi:NTP pyrophosphatase (non-canonical NTP hydrolase)